jgi:hypothetical protein
MLANGDAKLVSLAQDWMRDSGQAVPQVVASRVMPAASTPAAAPAESAKPPRYLRGVR